MKRLSQSDLNSNKIVNVADPTAAQDAATKNYVDNNNVSVVRSINQTTHGLSVGNLVKYSGSTYSKAQADSAANAEVIGIVTAVADANNFTLTTSGYVTGLSGLTAATVYFLDPTTAGLLTATEPSAAGQVTKPVLVAVSTTTGYVVNYRGALVTSGASYATLTGSETLTNKTLTAPTIADYTNAAHDHGDADDGGQLVWQALPAGSVIQTVITSFTAATTTTTTVPFDDTIPQITEGAEVMTRAITPKDTNSTLIIEAGAFVSHSVSASALSVALYQDATANALAATNSVQQVATAPIQVPLMHSMTAGTTSSTTFRIRVGSNQAGTTTFNGQSGGRIYGAITKSWLKITEVRA